MSEKIHTKEAKELDSHEIEIEAYNIARVRWTALNNKKAEWGIEKSTTADKLDSHYLLMSRFLITDSPDFLFGYNPMNDGGLNLLPLEQVYSAYRAYVEDGGVQFCIDETKINIPYDATEEMNTGSYLNATERLQDASDAKANGFDERDESDRAELKKWDRYYDQIDTTLSKLFMLAVAAMDKDGKQPHMLALVTRRMIYHTNSLQKIFSNETLAEDQKLVEAAKILDKIYYLSEAEKFIVGYGNRVSEKDKVLAKDVLKVKKRMAGFWGDRISTYSGDDSQRIEKVPAGKSFEKQKQQEQEQEQEVEM